MFATLSISHWRYLCHVWYWNALVWPHCETRATFALFFFPGFAIIDFLFRNFLPLLRCTLLCRCIWGLARSLSCQLGSVCIPFKCSRDSELFEWCTQLLGTLLPTWNAGSPSGARGRGSSLVDGYGGQEGTKYCWLTSASVQVRFLNARFRKQQKK